MPPRLLSTEANRHAPDSGLQFYGLELRAFGHRLCARPRNVVFRLPDMISLHLVIVKYILLRYLATAMLVAVTVPD
jgi:hypothetical protein